MVVCTTQLDALSPSLPCAAMVSAMYERCSVLFNTAVLQGQIAKTQNLDGDEGLKTAARHFQVQWQGVVGGGGGGGG